ncbi:MAG: hypothetical protein ACI3ZY_03975 [Parabacteroides sp.]
MKQFYGTERDYFMEQCHAGLNPVSHAIRSLYKAGMAVYTLLYIYRMGLRVKPAKTQIVSCLDGSGIKGLKDVMQESGDFVGQTNDVVQKNGMINVFLESPLAG